MREEAREDGGGCEGQEEVAAALPQEVIDLAVAEVNRLKDRVRQGEAFMADERVPEPEKEKHRVKYQQMVHIYNSACRILNQNPEGVAIRTSEGELIPLAEIDERLRLLMETITTACDILDGEIVPRRLAPEVPEEHPRARGVRQTEKVEGEENGQDT